MNLPLVPSWILSALCLLSLILAGPAIYKIPYLHREDLIKMLLIGIVFIAAALSVYGIIYYYFTTFVIDIDIRQRCIRFANLFLLSVINAWLSAISLQKGVK